LVAGLGMFRHRQSSEEPMSYRTSMSGEPFAVSMANRLRIGASMLAAIIAIDALAAVHSWL
jgi:hypothetical protein